VPVAGPPQYGYWGVERWIDATYTPVDDSLEPDRFAFTAAGLRGDGPPGRMAIVPRRLPENGGGSCGYSPASIVTNLPGTAWLRCDDDDGDPLSAEVLTEPQHGIAASPVITPAAYGGDDITIPYVPNPGYEGYDCIKVRVGDGHGLEFNIVIDIWVRPAPPDPPPLPDPPGAPDLPPAPDAPPVDPPLPELTMGSVPGAPPPAPPHGSPHAAPGAAPIVPAHPAGREDVRALAEQALGTTAVKRLSRGGGTEVWARSKLSKNDLLRYGSAPGLAVVCLVDCEIRSDSVLAGVRRLKATRHKTVAAKTPGQAHVVALALSRAERKALRKARKPRGTFKLSVRPAGGKARPVRRSIPIRR
jgi:hypothetical protein